MISCSSTSIWVDIHYLTHSLLDKSEAHQIVNKLKKEKSSWHDGKKTEDISNSDIILVGVSRTSKTPTSIYLANRGYKTSNIPLVNDSSIPDYLKKNPSKICVVGLTTEPQRLYDLRRNRMSLIKEEESTEYTNLEKIKNEVEDAKKTFKKFKWPVIDVTRKSVEETAASILKIHDIFNHNE